MLSSSTKRVNKLKLYTMNNLEELSNIYKFTKEQIFEIEVVAKVLPFRTNSYVVEELIDWSKVPEDPFYKLTFLNKEMLLPQHYEQVAKALEQRKAKEEVDVIVADIRKQLNPHPANQLTANIKTLEGEVVEGLQHKYQETCLVFPSSGQTCFAYCTFCFRWPQFVGVTSLKFATDESKRYLDYIKEHKELTDVLFTGGDPLLMKANLLKQYIEPLLTKDFAHIRSIRIGTKVLGFWPYRLLTDPDAEELLALFRKVVNSGKHLAIMAHFNHYKELLTQAQRKASIRILETGAQIRTQSPIINHINDSEDIWARMWQEQVEQAMIPYYMFIERNTGPQHYFSLPLVKVFEIYRNAINKLSGLGRTARGPVMSAIPGKISIDGVVEIDKQKAFVLSFLQARNTDWVKRPFFAKYDSEATWFTELQPLIGQNFF
ncbi:MAG: lysine 2,3-aminomutase [Blastocatellia bacterium]